jgi:two-component sensor histidine kinase
MTPAPPTGRFRRIPVTALILLLILAVAAPSLAFTGVLLLQSDNFTRATMTVRATRGVDNVAEALERELRNMTTNLSLLASSGWVETERYERLHARASEALKGTDTYLVAVDSQNMQILNTRVPWGAPLGPTSDPATVDAAVARGQPAVSNVFFGRTAQREVFNVVLPVISGEFRVKALILTRDVAKFPMIFQETAPAGWNYAILDGASKRVAGDAPQIGPPDLLVRLCEADTAELRDMTVDGVRFSAAAERLDPWGWSACVWTSSDRTEAAISERWRAFIVVAVVLVAVSILLGAALGQMLAGAIRSAAAVGKALDAGGEVPEVRSRVREVDQVIGTLTRAARRRLQHEDELEVLLKETAHRAKNQIAIASALARLSARSAKDKDQLRDDLVARLSALARSIDMMAATPSGAVPLKELAEAQLEPFSSDHSGRLELVGAPTVHVAPATAQSLGLVLHELATNASKYGAWSGPEGRVRLEWNESGAGLVIVWSERNGPKPAEPTRIGFGSSLIEMMIERNLGGAVERDFGGAGLVVTLKLPQRPLMV